MAEPPRNKSIDSLAPYVADRVRLVLAAMKKRGYDPVIFEALRTSERQVYLYGIGRTHSKRRKPITWTLTGSYHLKAKAVDIISRSRGWDWPEFYAALHEEGHKVGLHTIAQEGCHLQWEG